MSNSGVSLLIRCICTHLSYSKHFLRLEMGFARAIGTHAHNPCFVVGTHWPVAWSGSSKKRMSLVWG